MKFDRYERCQAEPLAANTDARGRDDIHRRSVMAMRKLHARIWREARGDYLRSAHAIKQLIGQEWKAWTGPRTSMYFRYVVDLHVEVSAPRSQLFCDSKAAFMRKLQVDLHRQTALSV